MLICRLNLYKLLLLLSFASNKSNLLLLFYKSCIKNVVIFLSEKISEVYCNRTINRLNVFYKLFSVV